MAMIFTARELDCQFIWNAHSGFARTAGVPDKLVDNLRDKKELTGLSNKESAVSSSALTELAKQHSTLHRLNLGNLAWSN